LDSQVKVQGFRIELGEIEFHAKEFLKGANAVCISFENTVGNTDIALFIESGGDISSALSDYLKTKLPSYMLPSAVINCAQFPLNANGKIDKNALKTMMK
jgi:acyl-CoA synthetase (AMP-forming)/AMP-acid ligase II